MNRCFAVCVLFGFAILINDRLSGTDATEAPNRFGIAVLDVPQVYKESRRFKVGMDGIKAEVAEYEAEVRDRQRKIKQQAEKIRGLDVKAPGLDQLIEQLASAEAEIKSDMAAKRELFTDKEARLYASVYQRLDEIVSDHARRNGILLVLRFSRTQMNADEIESIRKGVNRAIVYQEKLDITDIVIERLNSQDIDS